MSSAEAQKKIEQFGLNEIEEKKESLIHKLIKMLVTPVTLMLLLAAILSFILHNIFDVYFILALVIINVAISFWHEKQADDAIAKIKQNLAIKTKVLRDGEWQEIESKYLVPGDVVKLRVGDIVPADLCISESSNLSINESNLTGESLPAEKKVKDNCFAGSFVVTGSAIGKITATGKNTSFGKTLITVENTTKRSLLEKDILSITKFLTTLSLICVVILSLVLIFEHKPIIELITLDLSLIIAGIPISLPTVMTLIISIGTVYLARKNVIVRKIASLENLSNVNLLLTDKTGTLTKNEINLVKIIPLGGATESGINTLLGAIYDRDDGPIDQAIKRYLESKNGWRNGNTKEFIPYDSERKHSTAKVFFDDSVTGLISFGAPQVILPFCQLDNEQITGSWNQINQLASDGYRTLALSFKRNGEKEEDMEFLALVVFSDVLREDSSDVIKFLAAHGVATKIISGDNFHICKRVASELNLSGEVFGKEEMKDVTLNKTFLDRFRHIAVFSEVLPLGKHELVQYAKKNYVVAVTGDGVNDIPPVKAADVGIAVAGATDSLKSTADITILKNGLSVIKEAVVESRKIFARFNSYAVYRISESFRLIFSIMILGLWYKDFPLSPIQIIILALLNDIPIISLAFNRVTIPKTPAKADVKKRALLGTIFGFVGIANSLILFLSAKSVWHLDWATIQTMFFLKLSISGHLLIYVAHTEKRWWKFLPSKQVIWATTLTQILATVFALTGFLMQPVSWQLVLFVWIWAFIWMQVSDGTKIFKVLGAK